MLKTETIVTVNCDWCGRKIEGKPEFTFEPSGPTWAMISLSSDRDIKNAEHCCSVRCAIYRIATWLKACAKKRKQEEAQK